MKILLKVAILGLDSIGGKQDAGLWWTVDLVTQDGILHLDNVRCIDNNLLRKNITPLLVSRRGEG